MKRYIILLTVFLAPFMASAQTTTTTTSKHKKHKQKTVTKAKEVRQIPDWATAKNYDATSHAYFPDYYMFYDPNRGGYVYWDKGSWNVTPAVPPALAKVDLSKSRIQILKGLSLDLKPELDYPHYMEMYPADHDNNLVPVPIPGTPGN